MAQDGLDLVGLLDADADAGRVDRGLDQTLLGLIARDLDRIQQQFLAETGGTAGTRISLVYGISFRDGHGHGDTL